VKHISKGFIFFVCILFLLQFSATKVYPGWFKHYGGNNSDLAQSIQQTSDGGYIVAGYTASFTYGNSDMAIYRLDSSGNKVWFKHYGGTADDYGILIRQTSDGSYILVGGANSYTYGSWDIAIYRLDSSGNKLWFKHYGGSSSDFGYSIQQTSDGGYILAGYSGSYSNGGNDFAIYKLDSSGNKVWFKHYGGASDDSAYSIQQTSDGGYIVAGWTHSFTYGAEDIAIYKLSSNGNKTWFKHYGGSDKDRCYSVRQASDGGYVVAGYSNSYTYGGADFAIYKLNSSGNKVWFKHYGGAGNDTSWSIQQISGGGYIVAGGTNSFTHGSTDFAIYKLDSSGNKTWFKHYGGTQNDEAYWIQQTSDSGYIVAGATSSFSNGVSDFGIYKLDSAGNK